MFIPKLLAGEPAVESVTRRFWPMSNDAKSIFFVDTLDSVLSHQTNTSIYVVLGLHPTYHRLSATYTYT